MDLNNAYQLAVKQTGLLVANVSADQLSLPTPCTDFDVRGLLNHIIGGLQMFDAAARSTSIDMAALEHDFVGDGLPSAYDESAAKLIEALDDQSVIMNKWEMPWATMPGMIAVGVGIIEAVQHGWDLAKATGQTTAFDSELIEISMRTAKMMPEEQARNPRVFGPEQSAPDNASSSDQLAAFLGRSV